MTEEQVWTLAHKPVTADELIALRDRLLKDSDAQLESAGKTERLGMSYSLRYRTAIDLDHLARLLDADTGTKRMTFFVKVKSKPKVPGRANGGNARAAKLTPERRKAIAKKAAAARWPKK